jgi:hypothetical protein
VHTNFLSENPFGRSGHKLKDNIKTNLEEIGWEDADWSNFTKDRDQWQAARNEPSGSVRGHFLSN